MVGALVGGVAADVMDLRAAVWVIAVLSVVSGAVLAVRMRAETLAEEVSKNLANDQRWTGPDDAGRASSEKAADLHHRGP